MTALLAIEFEVRPARSARSEEFVSECALVNQGDEPSDVSLVPLSSPSLCLQIEDEHGLPVLLPPPPVPGGTERTARLEPGQRIAIEHRGFVPAWTPQGRYRARVRYVSRSGRTGWWQGEIYSSWKTFEIGAPPKSPTERVN
jgi:hypothetical protein